MKLFALFFLTIFGATYAALASPTSFRIPHNPGQCPALSGQYSLIADSQIKASFNKNSKGNLVAIVDTSDPLEVTGNSQIANNGNSQQAAGCQDGKINIKVVQTDGSSSEVSIEPSMKGFRALVQGQVVAEYIR